MLVVDRGASAAPPPRFDDTQLLAAVRAGDARAANALYLRGRPIVERAIRKLLGRSDQDHKDIFQQVMVELVRSIDAYRGDCPFDAWIRMLAARVVFKAVRHRRVERRVLDDTWPPPDFVGSDQPAHRAMLRSTIDRVRRHIDDIDHDRGWAFLLHDVHGYDVREMAAIMGTSVAAAQSRLVRGRKELHERLAADPELAGELVRWEGER
jgi:RNA polymerase sigma-70 factor (ECF subfamily)